MKKIEMSVIGGKVGSIVFMALRLPMLLLSDKGTERAGTALGTFCHALPVFKRHRNRANSNLKLAFPNLSDVERAAMAKEVFRHFGRLATDFMRSDKRAKADVLKNVEIEGEEHFHEAFAVGKGVIVVTAHFGNWERFGHWAALNGYKLAVVARKANDAGLESLALKLRSDSGLEVLSRGNSIKPILKRLGEKGLVGVLPDQNSTECFVPFFGHPAGTVKGPAVLHHRTGAPILPAYCARTGPCSYKIMVLPMVNPGDSMTDEEITAELNRILESVVTKYPEQYLWIHDRWKSARRKGLVPDL